MPFHALEFALAAVDQLATVEAKVRRRRKSLADQAARAADSIALNLAEGSSRAGLDRIDLFRKADGSARERCASRSPAATSPPPTSPPSMRRSTGSAPSCGGSPGGKTPGRGPGPTLVGEAPEHRAHAVEQELDAGDVRRADIAAGARDAQRRRQLGRAPRRTPVQVRAV